MHFRFRQSNARYSTPWLRHSTPPHFRKLCLQKMRDGLNSSFFNFWVTMFHVWLLECVMREFIRWMSLLFGRVAQTTIQERKRSRFSAVMGRLSTCYVACTLRVVCQSYCLNGSPAYEISYLTCERLWTLTSLGTLARYSALIFTESYMVPNAVYGHYKTCRT